MPFPVSAAARLTARWPLMHLCIMAVLAHLCLSGVRFTTSLYALSLHVPTIALGLLMSLFALMPTLFAVHTGRWLDRIGIAWPLRLGGLALAGGTLLAWLSPQVLPLYPAAASIGAGFMMMHIASQNMVGMLSDESNRAARFAWLAMGFSVSGFSGPVLSGLLIDHLGHRSAYLLWLGCSLLVCGLAWLPLHIGQARPVPQQAAVRSSVLDLCWHNRRLREIFLITILIASAWDIYNFMVPVLGHARGFSASRIGIILGVFSSGTFAIRLLTPHLTRYLHAWQVLTLALLLISAGFAVMPMLPGLSAQLALAFVFGLAMGAGQPNILSLLHQSAPAGRAAEVVGIRVSLGNASQLLFPLGVGTLSASFGLMPMFLLMSACVASGLPICWRRAHKA